MMRFLKRLSPTQTILLGFLALIFTGGVLLMLPISSVSRSFTNPLDAFFTAASASCVTGLVVHDTATYWSAFGKAIILFLIQIGGLGFMSMAFLVSTLMKLRVSPRQRLIFVQSMNLPSYDKVMRFFFNMIGFVLAFEGLGALLLSFRFVPLYGWWDGICKSIFHSVSAFCNAGFDIFGADYGQYSSLTHFADDPYVSIVISLLIIFGGLGFVVWQNIYNHFRRRERLTSYSRLVLYVTAVLLLLGTSVLLAAEWNNPATIGSDPFLIKLLKCFFQSATFRTAGFNTIDMGSLTGLSKAMSMVLMFIGGSSGSTAGGIKTVTFGILAVSVFQIARGRREINILKRRVDNAMLLRAVSVTAIGIFVVFIGSMLLGFSQSAAFPDVLFEAFSAFGTVGLSVGITPALNAFGKIVIIALMYFGRVGILTITYAIMLKMNDETNLIKYPKGQFLIG